MAGRIFLATAYCSDFGAKSINGTGVTSGGTDLRDGKQHFVIAAGPGSGLDKGDIVTLDPDPFAKVSQLSGNKAKWLVDDTGGAIKGRHIDLYIADCKLANSWGRKAVRVTPASGTPGLGDTSKGFDPFGIGGAVTGAVDDTVGTVAKTASAIPDFLAKLGVLFESGTWLRIGKVLVGVFLGVSGLVILMKPAISTAASAVPTPIGQAVAAATKGKKKDDGDDAAASTDSKDD